MRVPAINDAAGAELARYVTNVFALASIRRLIAELEHGANGICHGAIRSSCKFLGFSTWLSAQVTGLHRFADLATWEPRGLSSVDHTADFVVRALYRRMGNLSCSAATLPPPPPSPLFQLTERTTPAPVPSAESTSHSGMSPQGSNLQGSNKSGKKSTPQPLQFLKSSSPRNTRTMVQSVAAPKRSNRSDSRPTSPGESGGRRAMDPQ